MNDQAPDASTATAPSQLPAGAAEDSGMHDPGSAVEHTVMQELVRTHQEGGLVLILKNSNGTWSRFPL